MKFLKLKPILFNLIALVCANNLSAQTILVSDGGSVNACSGTFTDAGGTGGSYLNGESYQITLCSGSTDEITVSFNSWSVEGCCDYLTIYDGNSTAGTQLFYGNGSSTPTTYTSTNGCLTFTWTSDGSVTYAGWDATISCATPTCSDALQNQGETGIDCGGPCPACLTCNDGIQNQGETDIDCGGPNCPPCGQYPISTGGTVTTCSGLFTDAAGSGANYSNSENYQMTFCSGTSDEIAFDFTTWSVETCCDYLTIYDGNSTAATQIFYGNGSSNPGMVESTNGCLTFTWTSDGSVTYAGWEATISCYTPSCTDGIQNQGETAIDCGGPCTACPSCVDGIQNQGETAVDCGGPCSMCPIPCSVSVTPASLTLPCNGGSVDLVAAGIGSQVFALNNSFDGGNAGSGWSASPAAQFDNPCDPSATGGSYMWMGSTTAAPRTLETAPLDVSCGGEICFFFDMASQGGSSPCEGPDEPQEGVYLEWSSDGGTTWNTIVYYGPNGINDNTNSGGTNAQMTAWNQYCYTIPAGAETPSTIFHWYQDGSSGTCCDHWGIDDVQISLINCNPYYYDWTQIAGSPNDSDITEIVTVTTTYEVTYTNGVDDACSTDVTIIVPIGIDPLTVTPVAESCDGLNDGTATVSAATGGTAPYTYAINGPPAQSNTTGVFTGLADGIYAVTVTDAALCMEFANVTITPGPLLTANIAGGIAAQCETGNNYSFDGSGSTITVGSITSYTWGFGDGQTGTGINPSNSYASAGSYNVTLTVSDGSCTDDFVTTIVVFDEPTLSLSSPNPNCNLISGEITATGSNGTPGYNYTWSTGPAGGGASQTNTALSDGTYTVTISDANSCSAVETISIVQPPEMTLTQSCTDITAPSANDGMSTISVLGGQTNYIYNWNTGSSAANISGLSAGTYTVTITDANGCTSVSNCAVVEPNCTVSFASTVTPVSCFGSSDGSATVNMVGGNPAFSYIWQSGGSNATENGLPSGTINVTITDIDLCVVTGSINIASPSILATTLTSTDVLCDGDADGTAALSVTGGIPNYTFNWSSGATAEDLFGLTGATYTVTVTDVNNCTTTASTTIAEPLPLFASVSVSDATCSTGSDGAANLSVTGGTTNYTYLWSNAATSEDITALSSGNYNVTVTDANGCPFIVNSIVTEPQAITVTTTPTNANCGQANGSASATAVGGTGSFTYAWSSGGTSALETGLAAAVYSVTVTDINGCTTTQTATINNVAGGTATTSVVSDVSCFGVCDGSASATMTGGATPYVYSWSNGSTGSMAAGLCPGTTFITVTDAALCTTIDQIIIVEPSALAGILTNSNVSCYGECDGTATANFSGGTTPYAFIWGDGQTTVSSIALCADTAFVTVTDLNGCFVTDSVKIQTPSLITVTTSTINSNCNQADGTAMVSDVQGGFSTYTYAWGTGSNASTITGLIASGYIVTVTDITGCTMVATAVISDAGGGSISVVVDNDVSCFGGNDGQATLTMTGGSGPFTYAWSSGGTGMIETNMPAGPFTVTATDGVGCVAVVSDFIVAPTQLSAIANGVDVNCNGGMDGAVNVVGQGGVTPYTYAWSNGGGTSSNGTGLSPSTYILTMTDLNSCTITTSALVGEPLVLTSAVTGTNATCFSIADGGANLIMFGGTTGYNYLWSNGATAQNLSNVGAGSYLVTITDNAGCTTLNAVTISEPSQVMATITGTTNVSCGGLCDGNASVSGSGGSSPFSYLWDDGQSNPLAIGLCDGFATVTVSDLNGCEGITTANLSEPNALVGFISSTNLSCYASADGDVSIAVTGGTTPYNYLWDNTMSTASLNALSANVYTVTVTDNNGCSIIDLANITEPTELVLNNTTTQSTCGQDDGNGSVTIVTGNAPFTYSWSSGANSANETGIPAGNYQVTVTDVNGCTEITYPAVTDAGAPSVFILTITDVSCSGGSDGFAQVSVSGGTPPYQYNWNTLPAQSSASASGLSAGTWAAVMTDNNGCVASVNVLVNEPPALSAAISTFANVNCFGFADGSATAFAVGGTPPYSYQWNDLAAQSTPTATGLLPGIYTATVVDFLNCNTTVNVTISEPAQILVSNSAVDAFCNTPSGEACVIITNGVAPFSYSWDNAQADSCAAALIPGNYTVTVTDINGCTNSRVATVGNIPPGTASISSQLSASCTGACDGAATVSMGGATAPYTYLWSNGYTSLTATGLCPIGYAVSVTDANGCVAVTTVTIIDPTPVTGASTSSADSCKGGGSGLIAALANGGTDPYTYLWDLNTLSQTGATATGLLAGSYTVTVTDNNGCTLILSDNVAEPNSIDIDSIVGVSNCGQPDGSACITIAGGTTPYSYLWQTMETTLCINNIAAGTYIVTVTDNNFCKQVLPVIVNDKDGPTAVISDSSQVSCNGFSDGSATVSMVSGTGTFTVQWYDSFGIPVPGQTAPTATNLTAGLYSVDLTDAVGCVASESIEITEPNVITYNNNFTPQSCYGICDATAGATVGGGSTPYTYSWTGTISSSNQVTNLCAGTYILNIADDHGCVDFVNFNLIEPLEILATISMTPVVCNGACDGTASVLPTNGIGTYSYSWDNTQSNPTAIGLCPGSYIATITDANGCSVSRSIAVTEPTPVVASISSFDDVTCADDCDGYIQASALGGVVGLYSYDWSNGQINQTAINLCDGFYSVTVSDANGCTAENSQNIIQPTAVTAVISTSSNVLCNGNTTGSANVSASGGVGGYVFLWDAGTLFQSSATANGLGAGAYYVTVTDANGCSETTNVDITEPTAFGMFVDTSSSHCGQNDGQICVTAYGGVVPYGYQWNDPFTQTDACADFISAGCYNVVITDNNGCIADSTVCINDISGPSVNLLSYQDITCAGASDGIVNVNVTGGTPPYVNIEWTNPNALPQFNGSSSALFVDGNMTYAIEVTDLAGCVATLTQFLYEPNAVVSFVTSSTNASCFGGSNGLANVSSGGGTPGYTYTWNDGLSQTTQMANTLAAGPYTVIVTDANNCATSSSVTISQPSQLVETTTTTDADCHGLCDASAVIAVSQATPPYLISWNPQVSSGTSANNLCDGNYGITVTDANACSITTSFTLNEPDTIAVIATSDLSSCSDANGSATLIVSGGTPGYTYSWNTNPTQTGSQANGLMSGSYDAVVTDANGCVYDVNTNVYDNPSPVITGITFTQPDCYGTPSGTACVNTTGGTAPLNYQWNDIIGQVTQCATALFARTYTVTVTDAYGCKMVANGLLGQPAQLVATGIGDTTICFGQSTIIWGVGQGGTTPIDSIVWDDPTLIGHGPHTVNPIELTDYCFTLWDENLCSSSACVTVGVRNKLSITGPESSTICFESEASFCATGFGGTAIADYMFIWDDGTLDTATTTSCRDVSPTDTTSYRVILSDGCSPNDTAWIVVNVLPLPPPYFSVFEQSGCPPFTAQFSGFTNSSDFPNATFSWEVDEDTTTFDGDTQFFDFIYETSGLYDVTLEVTSEHGCSRSLTNQAYIQVYPTPIANFTAYPLVVDLLNANVFVNGTSTVGSDSLSWDFGDAFETEGMTADHDYQDTGSYQIILTAVNDFGCVDSTAQSIYVEADFALYSPNAFTPNSDGMNDFFFPKGTGVEEDEFVMLIYDRWGEVIFRSENMNNPWDGRALEKNGQKIVAEGVYVWHIIAHDYYGEERQYIGHVTLLKP